MWCYIPRQFENHVGVTTKQQDPPRHHHEPSPHCTTTAVLHMWALVRKKARWPSVTFIKRNTREKPYHRTLSHAGDPWQSYAAQHSDVAVKIGGGHLLILLIMIIDVYCVANLVVEWWTSPPGTPLGTLCWTPAAAGDVGRWRGGSRGSASRRGGRRGRDRRESELDMGE